MQGRLVFLLLTPSGVSFAASFVAALAIIGITNWAYFTYSPGSFEFFYGPRGIVTTLEQSPDVIRGIQQGIADNPVVYGAGIVLAALVAGALIFLLVRVLERGIGAVRHLRQESADSRHEEYRLAFVRTIVCVVWGLYTTFFVVSIVPFCLLLSRIGAENISETSGLLTAVAATALLILSLHIHVVFARVLCMRPRVFGGEAAIEAATLGE